MSTELPRHFVMPLLGRFARGSARCAQGGGGSTIDVTQQSLCTPPLVSASDARQSPVVKIRTGRADAAIETRGDLELLFCFPLAALHCPADIPRSKRKSSDQGCIGLPPEALCPKAGQLRPAATHGTVELPLTVLQSELFDQTVT